jgi:hypothetical protein
VSSLRLVPFLAAALLTSSVQADDALSDIVQRAATEQGAGDKGLLAVEGTLKAKAQRKRVTVPADTCVVVTLAVAEGEAALEVRPPETDPLLDRETGSVARVRYCTGPAEEKVKLLAEGRGAFALGVFPTRRAEAVPVAKAVDKAVPVLETTLPQRFARFVARDARGLVAMAPTREEDLGAGDPRQREVVLEAGRCYRVLAVAEREAGMARIGFDAMPTAEGPELSTAVMCAGKTAPRRLDIAVTGSGRLIWQLFAEQTRADAYAVGGEGDDFVARSLRSEHARADDQGPESTLVRGVMETAGQLETPFEGAPGRCYAALAVGAPSVRALEIEISDARGNVVARSSDGNVSRAKACVEQAGSFKARVRVSKGSGAVGLQVFAGG